MGPGNELAGFACSDAGYDGSQASADVRAEHDRNAQIERDGLHGSKPHGNGDRGSAALDNAGKQTAG